MSEVEGVLLVDKPAGPTSHDVVQWVRWGLRERSVGHCGTLDPAATGLLVICVGATTRFVEYLSAADKTYDARFILGVATDSADVDGREIDRAPVSGEVAGRAPETLRQMRGALMLPPPVLSAIKVDGRRAHARTRAGEKLELDPRPMSILEVAGVGAPVAGPVDGTWTLDATLSVSKGTYVRSIAVELGARLGVPVHLAALRRTRSGLAALEHPACIGDLAARTMERGWRIRPRGVEDRETCTGILRARLLDPAPLLPFPRLEVPVQLLVRLSQGQRLSAREGAFASLVTGPAERGLATAKRAPGLLVVVRHEPGEGEHGRIAPEKVIGSPKRTVAGSSSA